MSSDLYLGTWPPNEGPNSTVFLDTQQISHQGDISGGVVLSFPGPSWKDGMLLEGPSLPR